MADITDPEALRFVREEIRTICEAVTPIKPRIQSIVTRWNGGLNAMFPNDSSPVQDGRESEGVSRLKGSDVNSAMNIIVAIAAAYNDEILEKPCVRPFDRR